MAPTSLDENPPPGETSVEKAGTTHLRAPLDLRGLIAGTAFVAASLAALFLSVLTPPRINPTYHPAPPRAVVIVLIDTLRTDYLSCYGCERATSPNIDRLASEGALFEEVYSNSNWTKPSVASLFTGLWPSETGAIQYSIELPDGSRGESSLSPGVDTFAAAMGAAGYRTVGFVNNPHIAPELGFGRGFDSYEHMDVDCDAIVDRFIEWHARLDEGKPFYAYLHFLDPHAPYTPRQPYRDAFGTYESVTRLFGGEDPSFETWGEYRNSVNDGKRAPAASVIEGFKNLYCGEVLWSDAAVGRLIDELKKRGAYDETLIVVMADHGENFAEHRVLAHPPTYYFEQQIHVPLVIKFPGSWDMPPVRVSGMAQTFDVTATVSRAACGRVFGRGRDLVGACLAGRSQADMAVTEAATGFAVHAGSLKAVFAVNESEVHLTRLYNLAKSPGETADVLADRPSFASIITGKASRWRAYVDEKGSSAKGTNVDEELMEQLRNLGYAN